MAYRGDLRMGMGSTHTICDGLVLEPLLCFLLPPMTAVASVSTSVRPMCDDHVLIALMDKNLCALAAVVCIECIPSGYIGCM
jgi:hypothetical protein